MVASSFGLLPINDIRTPQLFCGKTTNNPLLVTCVQEMEIIDPQKDQLIGMQKKNYPKLVISSGGLEKAEEKLEKERLKSTRSVKRLVTSKIEDAYEDPDPIEIKSEDEHDALDFLSN